MRSNHSWNRSGFLFFLIACAMLVPPPARAGSAFTYQGQLQFNGQPLTAECTFAFSLWDALSGGTQQGDIVELNDVVVTNGLFTVQLDFGGTALGAGPRWLQTALVCEGGPMYGTLSPRQPLTATPYAYMADTVAAGAVGSAQIGNGAVTSLKIADGTITAADVDTSSVQRRVTGSCAGGTTLYQINSDGTVVCAPEMGDISAVNAGTGLTGGGTSGAVTLAVDTTSIQQRVGGTCTSGTAMTQINQNGTVSCASTSGLLLPYLGLAGDSSPLFIMSNTGSGAGIQGLSTEGTGVSGKTEKASSVTEAGVVGESTGSNGIGVRGVANNGSNAWGVFGESTNGRGVYGNSTNSFGVYGATGASCDDCVDFPAAGVTGESSAINGVGVRGIADGQNAAAVVGTTEGAYGVSVMAAAFGHEGWGVYGRAEGEVGVAVRGAATGASGRGVYGTGTTGVEGRSPQTSATDVAGVRGEATENNGIGVRGVANVGTNAWAVNGESTNGYAGYFQGKVNVTGQLTKGGGSFRIDHPLDPANQYLSHSFVESPDMKNVYDGVVTLDDSGEAMVDLPEWFGSLNRDFRYQLTCIGAFAPVYVADEIDNNRFRIAGGSSGMKVSWQVTGIRHDAFAKAHPIVVEEEKPAEERGFYLHPVELGQPESLSVSKSKNAPQ
jgi:hypothetical protein